jgi:hypothetical protein
MATSSISNALAAVIEERERLRSEISTLESQLSEVEAAIASLDRLTQDGTRGTGRGRAAASSRRGRPAARSSQGRTTPTMVSLIESYVDSQGRKATHADEILAHLASIDRAPGGKNPKATLQTTLAQLQKRGRVKNIGRNRWRLVRSGTNRNGSGVAAA